MEFVVKIEEVKAGEREDALFECVLTHPVSNITWMGNGNVIQDGEKYSVSVSDHKLIHRLIVRDCLQGDRGIYSAVVGKRTCSAWLMVGGKPICGSALIFSIWPDVERVAYFSLSAERDPASAGEKALRKTSLAGGARVDLEKAAQQQQLKLQEQMERILTSVKATQGGGGGGGGHARESNSGAAGGRKTPGGSGREQQGHIQPAQAELNRLAGERK